MQSHKLSAKDAARFILAGNATFTIRKTATGGRFTYKVTVPADCKDDPKIHFVSVLVGNDNESDYAYIGYIRGGQFIHGFKKSTINAAAPSVVVFTAVYNDMLRWGQLSSKLEIWHEGTCGRCGRKLTVPESITNGLGPECAGIINKHKNQLV